jgi:hypothetical protein
MSFDRNKNYYNYKFSNGERQTITPIEAHKYAHKHKVDILEGPNYIEGKKEKSFDGFGWHDGLLMSFRGPQHYRTYLKENGLVEAGLNDRPDEKEFKTPLWDEHLIWKAINVYKLNIGSVLAEALLSGEMSWPEDGMSSTDG